MYVVDTDSFTDNILLCIILLCCRRGNKCSPTPFVWGGRERQIFVGGLNKHSLGKQILG